ncbi:MAG TPA: PspC domain-containing protein [Thermoanaerobaculia bacterium]|nr:PspC domain-containing protein [Thermoanaerobaculia bacterium]
MPLHRSRNNRVIAGVCGGVAEWLGWSPLLVRVLWVILTPTTLFAGSVVYLLLWILMPQA